MHGGTRHVVHSNVPGHRACRRCRVKPGSRPAYSAGGCPDDTRPHRTGALRRVYRRRRPCQHHGEDQGWLLRMNVLPKRNALTRQGAIRTFAAHSRRLPHPWSPRSRSSVGPSNHATKRTSDSAKSGAHRLRAPHAREHGKTPGASFACASPHTNLRRETKAQQDISIGDATHRGTHCEPSFPPMRLVIAIKPPLWPGRGCRREWR